MPKTLVSLPARRKNNKKRAQPYQHKRFWWTFVRSFVQRTSSDVFFLLVSQETRRKMKRNLCFFAEWRWRRIIKISCFCGGNVLESDWFGVRRGKKEKLENFRVVCINFFSQRWVIGLVTSRSLLIFIIFLKANKLKGCYAMTQKHVKMWEMFSWIK